MARAPLDRPDLLPPAQATPAPARSPLSSLRWSIAAGRSALPCWKLARREFSDCPTLPAPSSVRRAMIPPCAGRRPRRPLAGRPAPRPGVPAAGGGAGLGKPRIGIAVEFGEAQCSLLLNQVRFRSRKVRLGLADATLRIHRRLARLQLILAQLFLQHGDLIPRALHFCLRVGERGARLILLRAHLCVVEPRDHLPRRHGVALAHGDFENFSAGFRRYRGIVAFDAPAERDDVGRQTGGGKKYLPDDERGEDDPGNEEYPHD